MTKQKWLDVYNIANNECARNYCDTALVPENWVEKARALEKFIENINRATEVYMMENKLKGDKK